MRTTFIVGFPGESDAESEELVEFVSSAKFERCGVFPYSLEPGTPAEKLPDHLSESVKQERRDRLMAVQQKVAFDWASRQIDQQLTVIVDGPDPEFESHVLARGMADAPDIDTTIRLKGRNLQSGDLVKVKVTAADGYDLVARAVGSPW
jgi:ribosomal protein S12 methylthiotransferase